MSQPLAAPPTDPAQTISAYRWTLAWIVFGILIAFFAKLQFGKRLIYYLLALVLFFLIVTQYQAITALLSPFSQIQSQGGSNAGTT